MPYQGSCCKDTTQCATPLYAVQGVFQPHAVAHAELYVTITFITLRRVDSLRHIPIGAFAMIAGIPQDVIAQLLLRKGVYVYNHFLL